MPGERQALVTDLRELGDNRTLVLYTNDNRVYRRIRDSLKPIKIVPYEQEQDGRVVMVGVDIHLPKKYRKWLAKNIGVHAQKVR